jgi:hypothetical protein
LKQRDRAMNKPYSNVFRHVWRKWFAAVLLSISTLPAGLTSVRASGLAISSVTISGSNLVVSGSGGVSNATYYVLASTNLALSPMALWTRISTNVFSADGQFTITSPLDSSLAREFIVVATTVPAVIPGLVAAYPFDEGAGTTVSDVSGNGNNGTIINATWTASGRYGNALVFDGTSALVTVNDSSSLELNTAMTLEAWVNPVTVNNVYCDVIYKGNDNYFLEGTTINGSGVPGIGGTFGAADVVLFGPVPLTPNTWAHLAATYDGAMTRLYVNGTQVASQPQTGTIATSTNALQIGGDSIYSQFFQGTIDEVRIYNRALSAMEIQADMNVPVGTVVTPPGNLTATVAAGRQINLNWTASSANLGVGAYLVERCDDAGNATFTQIGTATGTGYADAGLAANTTYSYRIRAVDATGNLSPYSNIAQGNTGLSIFPRVAALTFTRTQQFSADGSNLTWSVDGVAGGSALSGTITSTGLYSPPAAPGTHTVTATETDLITSASATVYITDYPGVFTHHNDNFRTGQNLDETVLTPTNVNMATFGKLFSCAIDGISFASPLYVADVSVPGNGFHNLVFVETEHDSVYAFDADGLSTNPVWQVSFINPAAGVTTVPPADTGETWDIPNEIGITGTPVIDPATGTLFVVAATKEIAGNTANYVQRLHALDITTGAEKFGGPVVIQASVSGNGVGSQGGAINFDPLLENQRPALLLNSNVVFIGFGVHGNPETYHGWVLGYDATNLQQVMVFNSTPNARAGGVWQAGGGMAADSAGNLFFATGNGTFDANVAGGDYGDSVLRLGTGGAVLDYFSPHNQQSLDTGDVDLGSGGVLLLPDQSGANPHLLVSCGKEGTIYLLNRDNLGGFMPDFDSQIVQELPDILPGGSYEIGNRIPAVYFNGSVYLSADANNITAFQLSNGLLSTAPISQSPEVYNYPGGPLAISANGNTNGILWSVQKFGETAPGILRAYDPANLATEFYSSDQAGTRDTLDIAAKFSVPLVVNGKVFVASEGRLTIYGLLP